MDEKRIRRDDIALGDKRERFVATGGAGAARASEPQHTPLFPEKEAGDLKMRWEGIQAIFVDEPREAVRQADEMVAAAMKRITEIFSEERKHLEGQWDRGGDVSTEELRLAFQRYRSFFGRLLSV